MTSIATTNWSEPSESCVASQARSCILVIFHLFPLSTGLGHTHPSSIMPSDTNRSIYSYICSYTSNRQTLLVEPVKGVSFHFASWLTFNHVCSWPVGHVSTVKAGATLGLEIAGG